MIARRPLLAALCGCCAAAVLPVPSVVLAASSDASSSKDLWSTGAFAAAKPITDATVAHPFIEQMAKGTLKREIFLWYVAQNVYYLENYAEAFRMLQAKLPEDEKHLADRWISETYSIHAWTKAYYKRLTGHAYEESPYRAPAAETIRYARFESRAARSEHPAIAMAALLPCFTVYQLVGRRAASIRTLEGNPYAEWVGAYGDGQDETTVLAVGLADRLAAQVPEAVRSKMTERYLEGCRLEKALWDAAMAAEK